MVGPGATKSNQCCGKNTYIKTESEKYGTMRINTVNLNVTEQHEAREFCNNAVSQSIFRLLKINYYEQFPCSGFYPVLEKNNEKAP